MAKLAERYRRSGKLLQDGMPDLRPHDLHAAQFGRYKFTFGLVPVRDQRAALCHFRGKQLHLLRGQAVALGEGR